MVVRALDCCYRVSAQCCRYGMLLAAVSLTPVAASQPGEQALATGLARFALVSGQADRALGYIRDAGSPTASWLRVQALMASGQTTDARMLLEAQVEGEHQLGAAALMLAQILLKEGEPGVAREHFQTAADIGHGEVRQQALYELAELERRAGHRDRAGRILSTMDAGYWAALGYANLAADYSEHDLDPTRALVALRVALAMSEQDTVSGRSSNLRNQLLVRAGYLSYQNEEYDKAIGFLEQVPLDSYQTPRALYFHGLALAARDNHRAAMQSWHRAKKYPLAYPGVQDAWLGVGRGYDLSGYPGQAGEAYLAANASYEGERVTLRKLASQIRKNGAWRTLVQDTRGSEAQWFLADNRTLTQPRMAYLLRFMEDPAAQDAVGKVSDLARIEAWLEEQANNLDVFRGALKNRLATPVANGGGRQEAFVARLEKLRGQIGRLRDRAVQPRQLEALNLSAGTLQDIESSLMLLGSRLATRDARLEQLLHNTDAALTRIQKLQSRAATLRARAESRLDDQALAFVSWHDDQLEHALDKTEQQIAHLYEYLALETLERGGR
ncbi:tetratricopeptide repeat protein [Marinobacter sp. NP-4(2019)]|uniref:tetratricopeptide repeat protein n=1 Tax=Marinobacter sp. NP-4(2019) TaxID=2488665 RepID=UPI001D18D52E|nr:hypothetical protein [Marinobacter sp. NP-4(2019)]